MHNFRTCRVVASVPTSPSMTGCVERGTEWARVNGDTLTVSATRFENIDWMVGLACAELGIARRGDVVILSVIRRVPVRTMTYCSDPLCDNVRIHRGQAYLVGRRGKAERRRILRHLQSHEN